MHYIRHVLQGSHSVSLSVSCAKIKNADKDSVSVMFLCSATEKERERGIFGTVRTELDRFQVGGNVNQEILRRMIYDVACTDPLEPCEMNKYNSVFVHSNTPKIAAVVAALALNRVFTSLNGRAKEQFEENLKRMQQEVTKKGNSIHTAAKLSGTGSPATKRLRRSAITGARRDIACRVSSGRKGARGSSRGEVHHMGLAGVPTCTLAFSRPISSKHQEDRTFNNLVSYGP
ncbi:hypothetical protein PENTCL1PPCAC_26658, partial [Pristionchus entomophagus]